MNITLISYFWKVYLQNFFETYYNLAEEKNHLLGGVP
jgi:hypothetical protein